jgi:multidrug resistance efflux pump
MRFTLFFLLTVLVSARIHYAKIEPYESVVLKSAVSAQVTKVDLGAEGTMIEDAEIVHLDDRLDKADLAASRKSLELLKSMLAINEDIVESLKESLARQKGYFERMNRLATASKTQKDTAFSAYVGAKNQYLSTREKIESLKKQILDMVYKIERLEDTIAKKNVRVKHRYLYKLAVRVGDFVNPGSALATVQDLDRGKLTLFLEASELEGVRKKKVYIDGEETPYHVDKVWRVADEKFISSYRVEIYVDQPKAHFSKLVKVELK